MDHIIKPKTMQDESPLPTRGVFGGTVEGILAARANVSECHDPACDTRRVTTIRVLDEDRVVPVLCPHQVAELAAKAEAQRVQQELTDFHTRYGRYRVPEEFRDLGLDSIDPKREGSKLGREYVALYLDRWSELLAQGAGMVFHGLEVGGFNNPGSPGTGKTLCATTLATVLEQRGVAVAYIKCRDLLRDLRNFKDPSRSQVIGAMRHATLLVLDELVNEHETAFTTQEIVAALDYRYEAGKPTIITTNFERRQIAQHYESVLTRGEGAHTPPVAQTMVRRLMSRMQPPRYVWVPFDGPDQRIAQREGWGPLFK